MGWLVRAIGDPWLSPAEVPVSVAGRKTLEGGQLALRALGLREEVLDAQFTGPGLQEKPSLIQQGAQEWFRALVALLTLVVHYCLHELGETLRELNGFDLNINRAHKV